MPERVQEQMDCEHEWAVVTGDQRNGPGIVQCKKCKLWLTHSNRLQLETNRETRKNNQRNFTITIIVAIAAVIAAVSAAGSAILALPKFSKQINNIQVKVDSIESSIQELYNRNIIEEFSLEDIKKFEFRSGDKANHLAITLQNVPIKNSVSLWFADQLTNPTNYEVRDNIIDVSLVSYIDLDYIEKLSDQIHNIIVVSYVKQL